MLDTIIVVAAVSIAALFVVRRLVRQFTSTQSGCNCTGCGQSGSCGIQDSPKQSSCCDSR